MRLPKVDLPEADKALLAGLGARLRQARKSRKLSETAAAAKAGIARATLQRAELGAPAVAIGTYLRILRVLGFARDVARLIESDPLSASAQGGPAPARARPARVDGRSGHARATGRILVRDYPQLHQLAWQLSADAELTPAEALGLYERNWRYVDLATLTAPERRLIDHLKTQHGHGVMLV